ncbi:MAG: hypothetical protein ABIP09_05850 [Gemmatimonadaceae bacterium]
MSFNPFGVEPLSWIALAAGVWMLVRASRRSDSSVERDAHILIGIGGIASGIGGIATAREWPLDFLMTVGPMFMFAGILLEILTQPRNAART